MCIPNCFAGTVYRNHYTRLLFIPVFGPMLCMGAREPVCPQWRWGKSPSPGSAGCHGYGHCIQTMLRRLGLKSWGIYLQGGGWERWLPGILQVNLSVRAALMYPGHQEMLQHSLSSASHPQWHSFFSLKTVSFSPGREHQHILPRSCSSPSNKMLL